MGLPIAENARGIGACSRCALYLSEKFQKHMLQTTSMLDRSREDHVAAGVRQKEQKRSCVKWK